jgi:hypothetical protein
MHKHFIIVHNSRGRICISTQYLSVHFIDLHPHGFHICLAHYFPLDIPIVLMIPINTLQESSKYPLPCGHSPSRPRLGHPLLCYIIPRVIHLSLPRISFTRRVSETSFESYSRGIPLNFSIEASLLPLSRHPSSSCYLNMIFFYGDHGISQGSHVKTISFFHAFQACNHHLSLQENLLSHLYHMHTITMMIQHQFQSNFLSNMLITYFLITHFHFQICSTQGTRFTSMRISSHISLAQQALIFLMGL